MSFSQYKGYSLQNRVFIGFLGICALSILTSFAVSYFVLKDNATEQSRTDQLRKSDALMASLDYAVSHTEVNTEDLRKILENKIFEISDISKADVIIYDLKGNYLVSNKDLKQIQQKSLPIHIINEVLKTDRRYDVVTYDSQLKSNLMSSYMILKNNMFEPIGIVYFPYYHSDSSYLDVFNKYVQYIIIINLIIIILSVYVSWVISRTLTRQLTKFSDIINRLTLFERDLKPIRYYKNDELRSLVDSYNKMIRKIQDQKERLTFIQKEEAWREMAKQVAHEVKNPLTPMKLTIQNFKRKFDPNDPDIVQKVNEMTDSVVMQIDTVATVASQFSQFAQLPEKIDEEFNLNREMKNIIGIFNDENIFIHANREDIFIKMDKIYLNRIITNLISNAQQAKSDSRKSIINVDLEQIHKKVTISVEDNGMGIKPEILERIFEPNFTSKNSGMGLGLTMVRKMVEDYKGEISVKSELGKGSKFTIHLPTNL